MTKNSFVMEVTFKGTLNLFDKVQIKAFYSKKKKNFNIGYINKNIIKISF